MTGHGSPAPEDRANHPGRQVSRLTQAMGWQGILSSSEAAGAMADLRIGKPGPSYSGEAVQHYGGAQRLAADAFRNRNIMPPGTWRENQMRGEGSGGEPVQARRSDNAEHPGRKVGRPTESREEMTARHETEVRAFMKDPDIWAKHEAPGRPIRGGTARMPSPEKFE